ncbi:glycosyltransferase family 4 protein [uncultured Microbacterium sp.]|uniref:glycosyltransferase family 4 protein n=1 Tax=uncultured Microbacterium sp. TaxID=191216 RepID=UPI0025EA74C7|nr:glycosyltransferase family 4 protein [uncultured Microbacterium sp.]
MSASRVWIATNNGAIGGGEVMLMHIAEALRELGRDVTVVAPRHPSDLADAARAKALDVEVLDAHDRVTWMLALRRWDRRHRDGILWCNGLVPAAATAGRRNRIVHLHQYPEGKKRIVARLARVRALLTVVPSQHFAGTVPGSVVLLNWTSAFEPTARRRRPEDPFVVGYLGRLGMDKGVHVLAGAIGELAERMPGRVRLRLAGESRFVDPRSSEVVAEALAGVSSLTDRVGWVRPQDLFDAVDVLVVPSVVAEPFGLVAAEAMSAGVPVIVSDAGGLPEVVGPEHGATVPAGDRGALVDAIAALAQQKSEARTVDQRLRWERMFSPAAGRERVAELMETATRAAGRLGE